MISVAMPLYNQMNVMHIALEGLCRQENAETWELLIMSEDDVMSIVKKYKDRLKKAGCVSFKVQKLYGWIPLPQKWKAMGEQLTKTSIGMILQAGDCYPHPQRIAQSTKAMKEHYDWYQEGIGYFYDLKSNTVAVYNQPYYYKMTSKPALNMCMSAKHARSIPLSNKTSSIDRFLYESIKNKNVYQTNKRHKGVDLHGANNISKTRGELIVSYSSPFRFTTKSISEIGLPDKVVKMINDIQ